MSERIVQGRIIRILDPETVIVNLGSKDGIRDSSIFSILGKPENVIDPVNDAVLGRVTLVKAKVKASRIYENFSIAVSRWGEFHSRWVDQLARPFGVLTEGEWKQAGTGPLRVKPEDVKPWASQSEEKVAVGDSVEATITVAETDKNNQNSVVTPATEAGNAEPRE